MILACLNLLLAIVVAVLNCQSMSMNLERKKNVQFPFTELAVGMTEQTGTLW